MIPSDIEASIEAIHAAPHQLVLAIAGAGSLALAWLHSVAGSSRTLLEAVDAYAPLSLAQLVGHQPAQAVSPETALGLAAWACQRAQALGPPTVPLLGIGCTAAIATDRQRRGAERCIVATQTADGITYLYNLTMEKGARDRAGEEALCSRLLVLAIAHACGIVVPAPGA